MKRSFQPDQPDTRQWNQLTEAGEEVMKMRNDFELQVAAMHHELEMAQHRAQARIAALIAEQNREWGHMHHEGSIRELLTRFRNSPAPQKPKPQTS